MRRQLNFRQRAAGQCAIGDEDAAVVDFTAVHIELSAGTLTEKLLDARQLARRPDRDDAGVQGCGPFRCDHFDDVADAAAREDCLPALLLREGLQRLARGGRIGDAYGAVRDVVAGHAQAAQLRRFPCVVDLPDALRQRDRADDAEHADRICDGVTHHGARTQQLKAGRIAAGTHRLNDRCQRRRVGETAGEQARRCRHILMQEPADQSGHDRGQHEHERDQHIVAQTFAPKCGKESGPAAQPDRIDEQYQADLISDLGKLQARVERTQQQAREENAGHADACAQETDAPERVTDRGGQEQQQQRIRGQQIDGAAPHGHRRMPVLASKKWSLPVSMAMSMRSSGRGTRCGARRATSS